MSELLNGIFECLDINSCTGLATEDTDVLNSKEATYSLFSSLKEKFNGDTLQVTEVETKIITQKVLDELRTFILGDSELESKQLALWPLYSFDIIPIQLISSIYELFFHLSDEDDEKGTYYTPLHLVNLVMDEVYPWEGTYKNITFFDPSCGSGIFLVEAYRRLVCRWMSQNDAHTITCDQLKLLLENSIFGVDINEEAIRVASFSLSLAMCDFLDPRSIWDKLSFPRLLADDIKKEICKFCPLDRELCPSCTLKQGNTVDGKILTELRWHVITYLNTLETILVSWQLGIVDREVIEEEFDFIKDASKGCTLAEFRHTAGGFPVIEAFIDAIKDPSPNQKKKL